MHAFHRQYTEVAARVFSRGKASNHKASNHTCCTVLPNELMRKSTDVTCRKHAQHESNNYGRVMENEFWPSSGDRVQAESWLSRTVPRTRCRDVAFHYHSSPSLSLDGTSMTRGLSMIRAVRLPFSTMPMIQAW